MPFACERREQPLAELAAGGPLLGRADRAQDLEGHAVLAQRLDALDARRLEHAALPDRVVEHLAPDGIDDADRAIDVGAVGDHDVLVDPCPDPGQVGGHLDLAVGDRVDHAIDVADGRAPQAEVLDRAGHPGHADRRRPWRTGSR